MGEGSGDGPSPARPRPAARTFPTHRAAPEEHFNAGCTAGPHSLRRRPATVPSTPPRELVCRRLRPPPCPATGAPGRRRRGRPREETGACQTKSDRPRAPLPIVPPRRPLACTAETVVSRETRTLDMPSDFACLPTPHLPGRAHSRRSPPGDHSLRRASSSSAAPSGDDRSRPPARQPFTAGAPRPAISAAASRYATAPAEAGS